MLVPVNLKYIMKNYLIIIITVSICVGIYNIIAPQFHGIEKYSKMIGMLIVLCVIISPIKDFLNIFDEDVLQDIKDNLINEDNEEQNEYDEMFNDYLASFSVEELKAEIKGILLDKFEIPPNECDVSISTEYKNEKLNPSHVQILLSGKSIFKNPYTIEEYFKTLLECSCTVLIK